MEEIPSLLPKHLKGCLATSSEDTATGRSTHPPPGIEPGRQAGRQRLAERVKEMKGKEGSCAATPQFNG